MYIYLLCLSAALLCYTGFQNQSLISLIRSIFSPCSTCCFGSGFSTTKPTCRNTSKDLGHNSRTSFCTPTKAPTPTRPQTASPPHPIPPMVCAPLDPRPRRIHQMHLWPRGRRNLGPLQGVPPVQRTGHPHRLEPNPHHRTARRMADAVPSDPATHHRPQADGVKKVPTRTGPCCAPSACYPC